MCLDAEELPRVLAAFDKEGIKDAAGQLLFNIDYKKTPAQMDNKDLFNVWKLVLNQVDGEDLIEAEFPELTQFIV